MRSLGRKRGEPSASLPPVAFVDFLQNHDQIGNRALGERLSVLAPDDAVAAALGVLLLSPHVPLLFMGEEWGARTSFAFFCDFAEPLATAVREGRRNEFAHFAAFRDAASRERIPDPLAEATFRRSKLDWHERESPRGRERLALVRRLLDLRRVEILPWLRAHPVPRASWQMHGEAFSVLWRTEGPSLQLRCNLGTRPEQIPMSEDAAASPPFLTLGEVDGERLAGASLAWTWVHG